MKHKIIENLIQKSLDHETNIDEEKTLHVHLSRCPACKQFYEEIMMTSETIGMLTEFYPKHGFNTRVLSKIRLRKTFAWRKIAFVFAGAWLTSIMLLTLLPWTREATNRLLTSIPALVRLVDKIQFIASSLSQVLLPFAKSAFNPVYPAIGLVFSIIIIYLFSKTIQKEAKCKV